MDNIPVKGPLSDDQLEITENAGILIHGDAIETVGLFTELKSLTPEVEQIEGDFVAMPGLVDVHTHLAWTGSRAKDYALRLSGTSYTDIARQGGGIWNTVTSTRKAGNETLTRLIVQRAERLLKMGITTVEIKSGYGLDVDSELKILEAIHKARDVSGADLVATCLAAHIKPKDFAGSPGEYLEYLVKELLPHVKSRSLSNRVDIYVDEGAFGVDDARYYLTEAKKLGFELVVHADQFSAGGSGLAVEMEAVSADHLEASSEKDIRKLAASRVFPVVLPGSSMGLGVGYAPARRLLDAGASLVIASDWNPGSAPMGNLLLQAAVLGAYEKLTIAETLSALTCRAAGALRVNDRGILKPGLLADFISFPCSDFREIVYYQGEMMPGMVWKKGRRRD
jgi:imidazolonepropionase